MKYAFIQAEAAHYPVRILCRVLAVSASGYYAWRDRQPSKRAQTNQALLKEIRTIHAESREIYGSPKIQQVLRRRGWRCGRHRIMRLMRQAGLRAKRQCCFRRTTQADVRHVPAANRLQQQFTANRPNQVWLADLSYIPTQEGWLYLATVLDLFSRRIVGWAMDRRMGDDLTQRALQHAVRQRKPQPDALLHHSDRGSQYTSRIYQAQLAQYRIQPSMSGTGNCYDNAPMESFFALLKTELVHHERYPTRQAAKTQIFEYIECFYNRRRIHSALHFHSPAEFEAQWQQTASISTSAADPITQFAMT
jgi:putative transposase